MKEILVTFDVDMFHNFTYIYTFIDIKKYQGQEGVE